MTTALMLTGSITSLRHIFNSHKAYAIREMAVSVGGWTWVVLVISNFINTTEITIENLQAVKSLLIDYPAVNDKYINKGKHKATST